MSPPGLLLIAGHDPSLQAGLQADLDAVRQLAPALRVAGVLTAVTAQGGGRYLGHRAVPPAHLEAQLEAAGLELGTLGAVKIGMVPDAAQAEVLGAFLAAHPGLPVVVDPVLASSSGGALLRPEALPAYKRALLSRATLETPNLPEAHVLYGEDPPRDLAALEAAARRIAARQGHAVLLKGGHLPDTPADILCDAEGTLLLRAETRHPELRGTGCRLASGVAAGLAQGLDLRAAVRRSFEALQGRLARPHRIV